MSVFLSLKLKLVWQSTMRRSLAFKCLPFLSSLKVHNKSDSMHHEKRNATVTAFLRTWKIYSHKDYVYSDSRNAKPELSEISSRSRGIICKIPEN